MQILLSTKSYFRQSRGSNSEMLKQLGNPLPKKTPPTDKYISFSKYPLKKIQL
jgi:hypothetical protein